jgi:hypothetical protein
VVNSENLFEQIESGNADFLEEIQYDNFIAAVAIVQVLVLSNRSNQYLLNLFDEYATEYDTEPLDTEIAKILEKSIQVEGTELLGIIFDSYDKSNHEILFNYLVSNICLELSLSKRELVMTFLSTVKQQL